MNTDFENDPIMLEALRTKYDFAAENEMDLRKLAAAIRTFNEAHPAPVTPRHRKLIEGHPVGRSVAREDEALAKLSETREQLFQKSGGDLRKLAKRVKREVPKNQKEARTKPSPAPRFRSTKSQPKHRRDDS